MSIEFLVQQRFQDGAIIGNTIVDGIDDDLPPLPPIPDPPNPQPNPQPEPEPDPQPNPQPTPSRLVIVGNLTGDGLEFVQKNTVLSTAGGGHSGQITVTERRLETDPQPEPQPQPDPDPDPLPIGDLDVEIMMRRRGSVGSIAARVMNPALTGQMGTATATVDGRQVWAMPIIVSSR